MPVSVRLARWRWRRRADAELKAFWASSPSAGSADWRDTSFLVVDAEMSSLDPAQGELLSLGWVRVCNAAIHLGSARHLLIRPRGAVGQSATIHRLRDCDAAGGIAARRALDALLAAAGGCVLVFHHAPLDLAFLDRLCLQEHGAPLLPRYLCTLQIEQRRLARGERPISRGDLTLAACRRRYGLPDYAGHNALRDALATAELLLAQLAHRARGGPLALREL